jgi:hypothetical protein
MFHNISQGEKLGKYLDVEKLWVCSCPYVVKFGGRKFIEVQIFKFLVSYLVFLGHIMDLQS